MASCSVLGLVWIFSLLQVCKVEELPRGLLLSWVRGRLLDGLGLDEPPPTRREGAGVPPEAGRPQHRRASRATAREPPTGSDEDSSQMILFPKSDSSCTRSDSFTYRFHPSINIRDAALTSAHFWFYAGRSSNSSALLFVAAAGRRRLAAVAPSTSDADGWVTYDLDGSVLSLAAEGPFLLQVVCDSCRCLAAAAADKTPFLHLRVRRRGPVRFPRSAAVPWSPSAVHLLQRPSQEAPGRRDCRRAAVDISFEELGWDSWVVHPEALTFYYCHGNCSARDDGAAAAAPLDGVTQCCAPVPGTMRSLKITTTSDGGFSFKHETLPNIIPEECACF